MLNPNYKTKKKFDFVRSEEEDQGELEEDIDVDSYMGEASGG